MQVALQDRCYVYNLQKLFADIRTLPYVLTPLTRDKLLKVGHSCTDDLVAIVTHINRTFRFSLQPQTLAAACVDLECVLFNCDRLNKPSLSDVCFRLFGRHLRKKLAEVSTGGKPVVQNELQAEYVALDALVPFHIYSVYRNTIERL